MPDRSPLTLATITHKNTSPPQLPEPLPCRTTLQHAVATTSASIVRRTLLPETRGSRNLRGHVSCQPGAPSPPSRVVHATAVTLHVRFQYCVHVAQTPLSLEESCGVFRIKHSSNLNYMGGC